MQHTHTIVLQCLSNYYVYKLDITIAEVKLCTCVHYEFQH